MPTVRIPFQNGPVKEHGVNGVTEAQLLAIVLDRLRAFNAGPYACRENAIAITKIEVGHHVAGIADEEAQSSRC